MYRSKEVSKDNSENGAARGLQESGDGESLLHSILSREVKRFLNRRSQNNCIE